MPAFDRATLFFIGLGGVLGAALRWLIGEATENDDGGWFAYAPNTSVTTGTDIEGFEPVQSTDTLYLSAVGVPMSTIIVNLLGCLILGILTVLLVRNYGHRRALLGAATGFCGSLTTFSTFAVDIALFLRGRLPVRDGFSAALDVGPQFFDAAAYLLVSVVGGAVLFVVGRRAGHVIVATAPPP